MKLVTRVILNDLALVVVGGGLAAEIIRLWWHRKIIRTIKVVKT
jgi:hypothetical protein